METLIIVKFICLVIGIMYGFSNVGDAIRGGKVTMFQLLFMSLGIAGFIFIQFKLY